MNLRSNSIYTVIFYAFLAVFEKDLRIDFASAGSLLLPSGFLYCSAWQLLFIAMCGLLMAGASLAAEHRLWAHGLR